MLKVSEAIGASLDQLDFVVESFHGSAGEAIAKVVENMVKAVFERGDELRQLRQTAAFHGGHPRFQLWRCLLRSKIALEDRAEVLLQSVQLSQFRGDREHSL